MTIFARPGAPDPPFAVDASGQEWDDPDDPASYRAEVTRRLAFLSAAELEDEIANSATPTHLFSPIWPDGDYGLVAAERKAGKTWMILDAAISVASGQPWLGVFDVRWSGAVVVFLGEGGKRKMLRRAHAVAEAKGVEWRDLDIDLCFRAPHLSSATDLAEIEDKLRRKSLYRLVIVDPLYLAAKGAKGSDLYGMAGYLEPLQHLCQQYEASLMIAHHWNKGGEGKGADRMTGVGPQEWGRVLLSAGVASRRTDKATGASVVTLDLDIVGDEIADTNLRIRRTVSADDPNDLDSPLRYGVELLDADDPPGDHNMRPATRRVLTLLEESTTALTVLDIGDILANDSTGIPLKRRTIQAALAELKALGMADDEDIGAPAPLWRAHHVTTEGEHAA